MSRTSVTGSGGITRRSESWPFYEVRRQCLVTAPSIVLLAAVIVLVIVL
jgi:hypothetical protein